MFGIILISFTYLSIHINASTFNALSLELVREIFSRQSPSDICSTVYVNREMWMLFKETDEYHACKIFISQDRSLTNALGYSSGLCELDSVKKIFNAFPHAITPEIIDSAGKNAAEGNCKDVLMYFVSERNLRLNTEHLNSAIKGKAIDTINYLMSKNILPYVPFDAPWMPNCPRRKQECLDKPLSIAIFGKDNFIFDLVYSRYKPDFWRLQGDLRYYLICAVIADNVYAFQRMFSHPSLTVHLLNIADTATLELACLHESREIMNILLSMPIIADSNAVKCAALKSDIDLTAAFILRTPNQLISSDNILYTLTRSDPSQDLMCTMMMRTSHLITRQLDYTTWAVTVADRGRLDLVRILVSAQDQRDCFERNSKRLDYPPFEVTVVHPSLHYRLLSSATASGHLHVVKYLMENLNVVFSHLDSEASCRSFNVELVEYLMNRGLLLWKCLGLVDEIFEEGKFEYDYLIDFPDQKVLMQKKIQMGIYLVKQGLPFSKHESAVKSTVLGGNGLFFEYLENRQEIVVTNHMVSKACIWGNLSVLSRIYLKARSVLNECMRIAVEYNYFDILQFLMNVNFVNRRLALLESIEAQRDQAFRMLMDDAETTLGHQHLSIQGALSIAYIYYMEPDNSLAFDAVRRLNQDPIYSSEILKFASSVQDFQTYLELMLRSGANLASNGGLLARTLINSNQLNELKILVDKGFDKPLADHLISEFVAIAVFNDNAEMVKYLVKEDKLWLEGFKDLNNQALSNALYQKNVELISFLLDMDQSNQYCKAQTSEAIQFLWIPEIIEAFIRTCPSFVNDILLIAVIKNSEPVVRMCLNYGANPNEGDGHFLTFASLLGNIPIVRVLLDVNKGNRNAMKMAALAGRWEVVDEFRKAGVSGDDEIDQLAMEHFKSLKEKM